MSAKRVTLFTCDVCEEQKCSQDNYSPPKNWTYEKSVGSKGVHRCEDCTKEILLRNNIRKAANKECTNFQAINTKECLTQHTAIIQPLESYMSITKT